MRDPIDFRLLSLTLVACFALLPVARIHAQLPDQVEKMASSIPLTTELLDSMDKFVKAATSDSGVRAEMEAMDKDSAAATPDKFGEAIESKYPKVAAAFEAADLLPADFLKASGAIAATAGAVELANAGMNTGTDKTVQANIEFFKANKDRCVATMNSLDSLGKTTK